LNGDDEWCNRWCLWMTSNTDDVSCLGWRVNDEVGYFVSRVKALGKFGDDNNGEKRYPFN
jgi:hypothetical protein